MILQAVEEIADQYHYEGGLKVTISVPEGEKIARKTFNPRLGNRGRNIDSWNIRYRRAYE